MAKFQLKGLFSRLRLGIIALFLGILASTAAFAMRVSPMVSELTTSGAGAVARVEVGNIGASALPFETKITRIDFDEAGNLVETPADEDFIVFPPQGLVPVSGRQVVRVQWIGRPDIPVSQAYYLWVRQLPVETDPKKIEGSDAAVSIDILYTMKSLIVVAPPGAKPDVEVVSLEPMMVAPLAPSVDPSIKTETPAGEKGPESQPGLKVVVTNKGDRYALMSGAKWVLTATGVDGKPFERTYGGDEISQTVGVGYLPPAGGKRTFQLPTGVALDPAKPIELRFTR